MKEDEGPEEEDGEGIKGKELKEKVHDYIHRYAGGGAGNGEGYNNSRECNASVARY